METVLSNKIQFCLCMCKLFSFFLKFYIAFVAAIRCGSPHRVGGARPPSLRLLMCKRRSCIALARSVPDGPGLACTDRMCPLWIFLELRIMNVVVTAGAICAKLQSKCHHRQTNTQLFTGRMPFMSPNQQCQSSLSDNEYTACILRNK